MLDTAEEGRRKVIVDGGTAAEAISEAEVCLNMEKGRRWA